MLNQPMMEKLLAMRLQGMVEGLKAQEQDRAINELSFLERLSLLVDQQWSWRENQALARRLKAAKLRGPACVEDIDYRAARGLDNGQEIADYTLWTSASDLANLRFYFHTYDDRRIRVIDLKTMDLDASEIKTIRMGGSEIIDDVSMRAK